MIILIIALVFSFLVVRGIHYGIVNQVERDVDN